MKWLKKFNQRPPDDLLLNLGNLIFWAVIFGVVFAAVVVF
jgi:hypothetical protein